MELRLPSPLERLDDERLGGVELFLKRDDLIHPDFPGNKWRKLKYNLRAAGEQNHTTLLTFGGAFSNHLLATAAAGHHFGFATVGIVRGEEHLPLNPVLARATALGMTLAYLDRASYREKAETGLREAYGDFFLIPEGGANAYALRGCSEIVPEIDRDFDVLCCSSGTGATLAGVATALKAHQRAVGFSALKGDFLAGDVARLQAGRLTANWSIDNRFHFGGFAKRDATLTAFVEDFEARHGIALDPVYEGKMMFGIFTGRLFPAGTRVVALL
ncbi:1-aminocyclopropane-1-carboxylate deaminase/D-cysteine desulfhydrase [Paractinoplanes toevensis]|uniref:1-aminocyclopropane-1-carboxylate deaminase n=1 Tax=Paractinoplanes toevensis TaxID=571911 RepID=A0A919WCM4_9ACTN|nr:pyridoxal-phosphate dependent enzyme [Actinoplanes toevensis]GIM97628.1 1-aminocyclopropane-1-carboxylate deaminase [Actinoplanes toevensis]